MLIGKNNLKLVAKILIIAFLFSGCAMLAANAKKKQEEKEKLEKQIQSYANLLADLRSKKIKVGLTTPEEVKTEYGEPSNTFSSASINSEFQMLIYEHPDASKQESRSPIRLYFNNGKLTYWSN